MGVRPLSSTTSTRRSPPPTLRPRDRHALDADRPLADDRLRDPADQGARHERAHRRRRAWAARARLPGRTAHPPPRLRRPGWVESADFLVFAANRVRALHRLRRVPAHPHQGAHDRGLPNREAVVTGPQRTGRVVTAGTILVAVALGAVATSHVAVITELGLGTAVAGVINALVIRALLAPALMALLEGWNWWSSGTAAPPARPAGRQRGKRDDVDDGLSARWPTRSRRLRACGGHALAATNWSAIRPTEFLLC